MVKGSGASLRNAVKRKTHKERAQPCVWPAVPSSNLLIGYFYLILYYVCGAFIVFWSPLFICGGTPEIIIERRS